MLSIHLIYTCMSHSLAIPLFAPIHSKIQQGCPLQTIQQLENSPKQDNVEPPEHIPNSKDKKQHLFKSGSENVSACFVRSAMIVLRDPVLLQK